MMHFELKRANSSDVELIRSIAIETFKETFSDSNSDADMSTYMAHSFALSTLTQELNHLQSAYFTIANDGLVLGYLKLNWGVAQTENIKENGLEIQRIYILKQYHGNGAAQLLMAKAEEMAQQLKVDFIWLGVWEFNYRALAYYQKNDFFVFDSHHFTLGKDIQTDLLMKKICAP